MEASVAALPNQTGNFAPSGLAPELFRAALGLFPTGVSVVAACDHHTGQIHGMTANAFMSVSLDPPLVLVSVRRKAHLHRRLSEAGRYGVSFLSEGLEQEARRFAGMQVDPGDPPEFELHANAPVLKGSMAWIAAEVIDAHGAGDHTLVIGQVLEIGVDAAGHSPLGFMRGRFARVIPIAGDEALPLELWSQTGHWG